MDLRRLGEQLTRDSRQVALRVVSPAGERPAADPELMQAFERLAGAWTAAVGRWLAGEGELATRQAGRECLAIFGELAAARAASIDEIVRLCLRWRDAAASAASSCAVALGVTPQALSQAQMMLQRSLDVTLVRLCECFEAERRRADEELRFLATHDVVTGLPNRTLISRRLSEVLERSQRERASVALLFIDVDNFKVVNDTLGHAAGDELLRTVTVRLGGVVGDGDTLGRFGGDEFVVIVDRVSCAEIAERAAERVLGAFAEPFILADGQARLWLSASVGIALAHRASAETLLRDADIAMYRAKRAGKNRHALIRCRAPGC